MHPIVRDDLPLVHGVLYEDEECRVSLIVIQSVVKHLFIPRLMDGRYFTFNLPSMILYPGTTLVKKFDLIEPNSFNSTLSS